MCAPVVPAARTISSAPSITRVRSQLDDVTRVRERRHPGGRRQLRDGEVLGRIDAGCVADEHADPDGAGGEVGRDLVEDPRHLRRGRSLLPLGADQPAEDRRRTPVERSVRHHVHARGRPRRREAVVDRGTPLRFSRVRELHRRRGRLRGRARW